MNVEAAVLSIIVGLLRKGRIANLGRIPFRGAYAFAIPLVLFIVASLLTHHTNNDRLALAGARVTNVLQYLVLITAIGFNLHIREIRLMGLGVLSNFLALTANGGLMPISASAAKIGGIWKMIDPAAGTKLVRHAIMTSETRLKPLTDLIPVPGFHTVLSIGDVVLAIGIFLLIQRYMCMPFPGAQVEKTR